MLLKQKHFIWSMMGFVLIEPSDPISFEASQC